MNRTAEGGLPHLVEVGEPRSDAQRSVIQGAGAAAGGFLVGVEPPAPGSVVVLLTRDGQGVHQTHLPKEPRPGSSGAQYRVTPPHPAPGQTVDYRLELRRGGRCLSTLPADGSWSTLIGTTPAATSEPDNAEPALEAERFGALPLLTHRLQYFASVIAELRAEVIGATPDGYRVNFSCENGRLRGPNIEAKEVEGTDYVCVRPDGIARLHKIATWRTADGALILEEGFGVTDLGPDGYERIAGGAWTGEPPSTLASLWSTADPAWQWLTRVETVSIGRTIASNLQLRLDVYLPVLDGGGRGA